VPRFSIRLNIHQLKRYNLIFVSLPDLKMVSRSNTLIFNKLYEDLLQINILLNEKIFTKKY